MRSILSENQTHKLIEWFFSHSFHRGAVWKFWMEFIMVKVQNAFELNSSIERFQLFVGWFMMTHNFFLRESA